MYRMQNDHLPLAFSVPLPFQGKTKPGPSLVLGAGALICHSGCSPSISGICLKPPPIYNLAFLTVLGSRCDLETKLCALFRLNWCDSLV